MARFKLDENLPAAAEALLRDVGHDVATVIQEELSGASDLDVHAAARAERRTVFTLDRGFGDPRRHPTAGTAGVVVLRLPSQDTTSILGLLRLLVPLLEEQELAGSLWVVEPHTGSGFGGDEREAPDRRIPRLAGARATPAQEPGDAGTSRREHAVPGLPPRECPGAPLLVR